VVLTTSTSEAYGYLFRLLCDAGDEVLVAQPSYPLFDFLADLEDVRLKSNPAPEGKRSTPHPPEARVFPDSRAPPDCPCHLQNLV